MDTTKIVSNLCDELYVAMAQLKEGKLNEVSNGLWQVIKKVDALKVVMSLNEQK